MKLRKVEWWEAPRKKVINNPVSIIKETLPPSTLEPLRKDIEWLKKPRPEYVGGRPGNRGLGRAESDVYDDILESGMNALSDKHKYEEIWGLLSERERQVTALTCLGYRSYEIAVALAVSYETVRSHSKHIYAKFGLNRKELRYALRQWNFDAWWEDHDA